MASAKNPQTNGLVERLNRILSETLAGFVNTKHCLGHEVEEGNLHHLHGQAISL